jgi:hypothetical protein
MGVTEEATSIELRDQTVAKLKFFVQTEFKNSVQKFNKSNAHGLAKMNLFKI